MTARGPASATGRSAATWLASASVIVIALACSDGYSTDDAAPRTPSNLTTAERLTAMNRLGKAAYRSQRWRYELDSSCALVIQVGDNEQAIRRIALAGATANRTFDRKAGLYSVELVPPATAAASSAQVLATPQWTDSTEMMSHLQEQLRECARPAARPQ